MNIIEKLRYYLFRRNLHEQVPRKVIFPNYQDAKKILIVYESDLLERNLFIKNLVRTMLQEDKDVVTWGYVNKKEVQSPILPQSRILGPADYTFLGDLSEEAKHDLAQNAYDILIDLTQTSCLPLHYVTLYAHSRFKVGRRIEDGLHDFMIDMPEQEGPEPLYHQILHYFSTIHSND